MYEKFSFSNDSPDLPTSLRSKRCLGFFFFARNAAPNRPIHPLLQQTRESHVRSWSVPRYKLRAPAMKATVARILHVILRNILATLPPPPLAHNLQYNLSVHLKIWHDC